MVFARAGVTDGSVEEMVNGYVYQSDPERIAFSCLAADGESGIAEYFVSVGTTNRESIFSEWLCVSE